MKKVYIAFSIIMLLLTLMYAEYRYIMTNLCPYYAEDGFLYIEIFGQADSYYAEPIFEKE